ncbi:MAG: sigma-70 family RNA polymerase sigma factor [Gammaproteobacteria bacterium]|nr:sigma-70 family RNA polymerase sigma factor [Gammaproteobacteria bacterium]
MSGARQAFRSLFEVPFRETEPKERQWSLWMSQAQRGDEDSYARLLTELAEMIKAYLLNRFGRLEMLDDCVQESLIAIHQARHTYDPGRSIRPWLFAIVRHKMIDMLRRQRSEQLLAGYRQESPSEPDPLLESNIGVLLGALSSDHREAVLLTKYWGFSVRESADRLGVSEGVVKVRVHRGIRKIRTLLESESL